MKTWQSVESATATVYVINVVAGTIPVRCVIAQDDIRGKPVHTVAALARPSVISAKGRLGVGLAKARVRDSLRYGPHRQAIQFSISCDATGMERL